MHVTLNASEIAELDKQDPTTASDGGFQGLMVSLQKRVNRATGEIDLTADDLRRIPMYAFDGSVSVWRNIILKFPVGPVGLDYAGRCEAAFVLCALMSLVISSLRCLLSAEPGP